MVQLLTAQRLTLKRLCVTYGPSPHDRSRSVARVLVNRWSLEDSGTADPTITRAAELLQQFASPPCLVLKPSPEALAALKAAGPGRIELLPDDAQIIKPSRGTLLVPAPTPVPVSERLPGPGDCDEEGLCWWFSPADPSAGTFGVAACWVLRKHEPEDDFRTHWLPAHALPLPQGEVE